MKSDSYDSGGDSSDASPDAAILIGRLRKGGKDKGAADEGDGDSAAEEAKASASEDVLAAVKSRDAGALKDALQAFWDAC